MQDNVKNSSSSSGSSSSSSSAQLFGELMGRSGTWDLHLDVDSFRFQRRPPGACGCVRVAFADVAGVDFNFVGIGCRFLCIYAYPYRHTLHRRKIKLLRGSNNNNNTSNNNASSNNKRRRQRHVTLLRVCSKLPDLQLQCGAVAMWQRKQKPVLVLLNPVSGSGRSKELFKSRVLPVLREAEVSYRLVETKFAGHAGKIVAEDHSLLAYSALAIVSGDGLLHEVVNGIAERSDWREVFVRLPLASLPTGSGNGFAASLAGRNGESRDRQHVMLCAAFNLAKFSAKPVDLMLVEGKQLRPTLACLSVRR